MTLLALAPCLLALSTAPQQTEWRTASLQSALEAARAGERQVLVYFWVEGSAFCAQLWGQTLTSESVQAELAGFVCQSADVVTPLGAELVGRFSVSTLPTVLVLSSSGEVEDALIGVLPEADFLAGLRKIRAGDGTLSALRRAAEAAPDDLAARYALALKLRHVGRVEEATALIDSIRSEDPQCRTLMGAQLALWDQMAAITAAGEQAVLDLRPMHKHLKGVKHPEVLFEGWSWVANMERELGELRRSREAVGKARPHVLPTRVLTWSFEVLPTFWRDREGLTGSERKLALDIAEEAAALAGAAATSDQPDSADTAADALEQLARFRWLSGRRDEARAAIRAALELSPEHPGALATLALVEGRGQ